jgi:MFS family permease
VIPVLPIFVRERLGAPNLAVGLVVTATGLTALLARPVSGDLADRHGYRAVMWVGAVIVALGGALYFLPLGLAGLVVVRLLLGLGEASLFTGGAAWVVSLAPHNRRGQLIGLYGVSMWAGISIGTFLGATLLRFGFSAVWAFSVAAPIAALLLISSAPAPATVERAGGRGALIPRASVMPGLALALASAGYAGLAAFVVLHLQARGIHNGVVVLSGFAIVYAGTRLVIGHLPDQLGPRRVAAVSGVGEAAGLLIIALAPNLAVAVFGALVMGVGFSLLHPSLALMVMNRTDRSRQGAALGAYTSFWDLGLSIEGPVLGALATGFGYPAVFITGAACALGAVTVALAVGQPRAQLAAAGSAGAQ